MRPRCLANTVGSSGMRSRGLRLSRVESSSSQVFFDSKVIESSIRVEIVTRPSDSFDSTCSTHFNLFLGIK